ncbi:transglutaminase-like domain-containing protein [Paenibacillus sp. 1P07SE]|uniref:transglutaminase-like domain-containing protein n=1 Tax=Paenibacillus sp. 1P07SE TaxID=3132209 RepID=UPI0039A73AD1
MKGVQLSLEPEMLADVEAKVRQRRELAKKREEALFGVLSQQLTPAEEAALKFLYAGMPVSDLADYEGGLFLTHVRQALAIRSRVPWGLRVPDRLWLYYVLPLRINNEHLEDYQGIIFDELGGRVAGLSMAEAILETNYWCHEKATYIGSDLRTLSPLGMIRNARGRCGEESTLAVAALRSIGIPARQCYTPRWAHCDDNHAWVEAWADGTWHYIGACEPEPVLDEGWFSAPARRAMLVHTRVPSGYDGPETITTADDWHTELNLLEHYAPVRTLRVTVHDAGGAPAADAEVQFQLYNYAELFPLATLPADAAGRAVFTTGYGELVVRAARDGYWDERKVGAGQDEVTLVLRQRRQPEGTAELDLVPPPERGAAAAEPLREEQLARHRSRIAEGERIRNAYEATFLGEAQALELAADLGLPTERVWSVLEKARGNSREIARFLAERTPEYGLWPLRLLESLNPKDLTDTAAPTLDDFLLGGLRWLDEASATPLDAVAGIGPVAEEEEEEERLQRNLRYVLCPRVLFEMLAPYKDELLAAFTVAEVRAFRADPAQLAKQIYGSWTIHRERAHMQGKATPAGTFRLGAGDQGAVDIMLVALLRSCGIPARLEPGSQRPQYWHQDRWQDADAGCREEGLFPHAPVGTPAAGDGPAGAASEQGGLSRGTLRLVHSPQDGAAGPALSYRENMSLGRLEDGFYYTLQYPFGEKDLYDKPLELAPGDYRLVTGVRLQEGTVLARYHYFCIAAGEETTVAPQLREPVRSYPVLAAADGDSVLYRWEDPDDADRLAAFAGERGAVLAWIDPRREPSRHLLRECGELQAAYETAGLPLLLAVPEGEESAGFDPGAYPGLPSETQLLLDRGGAALRRMTACCPAGDLGFPRLYVLDGQLAVRYAESGYKPGSVGEALQVLRAVRDTSEGGSARDDTSQTLGEDSP